MYIPVGLHASLNLSAILISFLFCLSRWVCLWHRVKIRIPKKCESSRDSKWILGLGNSGRKSLASTWGDVGSCSGAFDHITWSSLSLHSCHRAGAVQMSISQAWRLASQRLQIKSRYLDVFMTRDNKVPTFLNIAPLDIGTISSHVCRNNEQLWYCPDYFQLLWQLLYLCQHRNDIFDRSSGHLPPWLWWLEQSF